MRWPMRRLALVTLIALGGCEKQMQDMYDQPRYKPLAASSMFTDGGASRPPVAGTQVHARGTFSGSSSGRVGTDTAQRWYRDELATSNPYPVTLSLLKRGQDRFNIYCAPCHSPVGDGDGFIVHRGFPAPPSYHIDRLREAPDRHFFDVMTHGYGIMYPYADRVTPRDRWAIVAYIRALQLSQHAPASSLDRESPK
ncbi:MAG: cytochrome c [Proteobacteria bacterium]|nr:cytochrome c [Pseudomonadota bacterium]